MTIASLYALLLWAPWGLGANRPWSLAILQLLALAALFSWTLEMTSARRLEWRRTALDLPLALLIGVVVLQLVLGNRPLVEWALAAPSPDPQVPVVVPTGFLVGTVSPADTARSLLLFLTYAAVYVLVVNVVRTRAQLDRLVRALLLLGALLGFLGLLDYVAGEAWLFRWRDVPFSNRLSGPFGNPDHFASWLAMLACLGVGYLLARSPTNRTAESRRGVWTSREGREELIRRHLPFAAVALMALALLFTLSRAGILSLLASLGVLLIVQSARGRARTSLVVVGVLLAVTVGYGVWIGLGPLLGRLEPGQSGGRLIQWLTTLPMLRAFPLLGVGLGAYHDIYFLYQPPALKPGTIYFEFAHNDLLEVAVETGLVGAAIFAFAAWRIGADLLASHLLGRGRCPVGGGEGEGALRRDVFSAELGLGALAGVVALLVHSCFDFPARIPANGVLAATCLGIATVALHTRFGPGDARLLTAARANPLGPSRVRLIVITAGSVAIALTAAFFVVRPALVEAALGARQRMSLGDADRAVALAPGDVDALYARARLRVAAAQRVWESGRRTDGRMLSTWPERQREALSLLDGATRDLRAAIVLTPTSPYLHEQLGWAQATAAMVDPERQASAMPFAIGSLRRAIALQPANPHLRASLALLALNCGDPCLPLALDAGAEAVRRDPGRLRELALAFLPSGLTDAQWAALVPDSGLDRLELAGILDRADLVSAAADEYTRAAESLPTGESSFARWRLARLLARHGDGPSAIAAIEKALERDPKNAELWLERAALLAERRDPEALAAYRGAVEAAETATAGPAPRRHPFQNTSARASALIDDALPKDTGDGVPRYRRALARHLGERGLWDQALGEWDRVLAETSARAPDHFGRGLALDGLGRRDEALEEYRRAVSMDERSIMFRMRFARRLWDSDQYFQAINAWRTVVAQEPGNVDARLALAAGYARTGQRAEAISEYSRVLELVPDQPEARKALAQLRAASRG